MISRLYCLNDPITREVRYIGCTRRSLGARLRDHLSVARLGKRTRPVAGWIRSLGSHRPTVQLLAILDGDGMREEKALIALCRARGYRLTNATDGGLGTPGHSYVPKPETRAIWSEQRKGHKHNLGRKATPEQRAARSLRMMGNQVRKNFFAKKSGLPNAS